MTDDVKVFLAAVINTILTLHNNNSVYGSSELFALSKDKSNW
ncbi:MAG: hypothetical protein FD143_1646 [Ignavibacteria bacterium]|nr:MAG: hypothetical protein FD143_1646 [Ignavibacteria bacterium]KAF0161790.1 MAG: hypothetical protein FD188_595 [Ignavibacteria bacterium]